MKWSLVQRGLFFVCRGGPNAYIMQLKFMGWAYKKEAAAQFICATAPSEITGNHSYCMSNHPSYIMIPYFRARSTVLLRQPDITSISTKNKKR